MKSRRDEHLTLSVSKAQDQQGFKENIQTQRCGAIRSPSVFAAIAARGNEANGMTALIRFLETARPAVKSPARTAAITALIYVVLCATYIVYSGHVAFHVARTPEELEAIEMIKGIVFILVTGLVFFGVSYVRWSRIQRQEHTIIRQQRTLLEAERRIVAGLSAATVAHDLNNLLMALMGLVEKLKAREQGDPSLARLRGQIENGIERIQQISRRFLSSLGRVTSDKEERIDLKMSLEDLAAFVRKHPDIRSRSISTNDLEPVTVSLNRTLFDEAVLNLLINAAQAIGPNGRIELRLTAERGAATVEVHDDGPGVPEDKSDEIFEPCMTTKPEGTGIGLVAVKAFASSCGGEVSVGKSPLGGAVFRLRIPIREESSKEDTA
jgi:two-component system sensor histidine kinase HydH